MPPLISEREEAFDPAKNELVRRSEVRFWIARRDGQDVGRISAQIDPLAQKTGSPSYGQFGALSAVDDSQKEAETDEFVAHDHEGKKNLRKAGYKNRYSGQNRAVKIYFKLLILWWTRGRKFSEVKHSRQSRSSGNVRNLIGNDMSHFHAKCQLLVMPPNRS